MSIQYIKQNLAERFGIEINENNNTDEIDKEIEKLEGKTDTLSCMRVHVLEHAKLKIGALDRHP